MAPSAVSSHAGEKEQDLVVAALEHQLDQDGKPIVPSANPNGAGKPGPNVLDASKLTYSFTKSPREVPAPGVTPTLTLTSLAVSPPRWSHWSG